MCSDELTKTAASFQKMLYVIFQYLQITFLEFDVESSSGGSCYDFVRVYDGTSEAAHTFWPSEICGLTIPDTITASSSDGLYVYFFSDGIIGRSGFVAMLSTTDMPGVPPGKAMGRPIEY